VFSPYFVIPECILLEILRDLLQHPPEIARVRPINLLDQERVRHEEDRRYPPETLARDTMRAME
jgi:hypothetical protein